LAGMYNIKRAAFCTGSSRFMVGVCPIERGPEGSPSSPVSFFLNKINMFQVTGNQDSDCNLEVHLKGEYVIDCFT